MPNAKDAEFRRLQAIFRHSNDAILLIDINRDRILDANPRASQLLGYNREELLGVRVSDIHPDDMAEVKRFADKVMANGNAWTNELSCVTKKNRIVETEISASVVEFEGRECLVSLIRDISDRERLKRENDYFKDQLQSQAGFGDIIGQSPSLQKTLEQVTMVAQTDATVLIHGETGTGKELIAHAIHARSNRAKQPLVKVNCASIPNELFESEFFGHVKGAFTGAIQNRVGRFELAEGGTLFLDEVAEIPLPLQSKLLRVLQENQYERVGESRTRNTNVRIIAATSRDLLEKSHTGNFRSDLYYRLSIFPVELPPLRERKGDIPLLAQYFISEICRKYGFTEPKLNHTQLSLLESQDWPGNIRELQNVIERAIIHTGGQALTFQDVLAGTPPIRFKEPHKEMLSNEILTLADLKELEKQLVTRALKQSHGKIYGKDGAAARLGIAPTTLNYRIKKLSIR